MLEIISLMDDKHTHRKDLIAEHGLSLYVCYNGKRLLFDCGSSDGTIRNAEKLGVDLRKLDAVVLSHSHYDHAAGFRFLIRENLGSGQVYTGPGFFLPKYSRDGMVAANLSAGFDRGFLTENGIVHCQVDSRHELFSGAYLVSGFPREQTMETIPSRFVRRTGSGFEQDDFQDEVCLALDTAEGLVVLVGCAHPGIINMVRHVRTVLGKPVFAVFGGTHLVEADGQRVQSTMGALREAGVKCLGLSHCSGEMAECAVRESGEVQGCRLGPGDCVFFD